MDATTLTFGLKDVVGIVVGVGSLCATYFTLRYSIRTAHTKIEQQRTEIKSLSDSVDEKLLHAKNAKKANIQSIMDTIQKIKEEVDLKEEQIYDQIGEVKAEQKEAHDKLSAKIDVLASSISSMDKNLAEFMGYIRAKQESDKKQKP